MARLIDAEFIEKWINREEHNTPDERWRPESEFAAMIDNAPTVDAVEVVRCKDCNFFIDKEDPTFPAGKWESIDGICWRDRKFTCHDDYCSCGAKMAGGDERWVD